MAIRRWWARLLPGDDGDRAQFTTVFVWLLVAGGVIGTAALAAALVKGWIGVVGFAIGLAALPAALYGLARLVWSGIAVGSRSVGQVLLAGGNLTPPTTFSAEEALLMQGRVDDARRALDARLRADPRSIAVRFRLAALLRDELGDPAAAERLYIEARTLPDAAAREESIANALIDLYQGTGQRGRLMAELARYAARHRGRPEGAAARRRLAELKADSTDPGGRPPDR